MRNMRIVVVLAAMVAASANNRAEDHWCTYCSGSTCPIYYASYWNFEHCGAYEYESQNICRDWERKLWMCYSEPDAPAFWGYQYRYDEMNPGSCNNGPDAWCL